ncbi:MAG: ParB N-terminal domain-containing protein [Gemmataceae bacterium]|nr:ParB N-terminal domain-containing protein [Gemmataceae bacterium]
MPRKVNNTGTTPVYWPISRLRPHPRQADLCHDLCKEDVEELARDLDANGQRVPVEVLPDGTILCGHQRVRALLLLGRKRVWVVVRYDLAGDEVAAELRLIEDNLHRRQHSALDRVRSYVRIHELERDKQLAALDYEERGKFRDHVARRLGISGRNLDRYLAVPGLPMLLQKAFDDGRLSLVEAARVATIPAEAQEQIAAAIEAGNPPREAVSRHLPHNGGSTAPENPLSAILRGFARSIEALQTRETAVTVRVQDIPTLRQARDFIDQLLQGASVAT